tara:strand:+ start:737 stop:1972 length:1236 start_codon:yes stop_codon:yes gene_type:complete
VQNFELSYKTKKFFGDTFFIFGMIPSVNFGFKNLDSQPWTFIFSIIFLIMIVEVKLPKYSLIILILTIFGLIITFINTDLLYIHSSFRAIIGYLGLPVIYIAFYNYYIRYGFPIKLFIFFNILWIFFGFLEFLLPEFIELISSRRTSAGRGVTSLAPEPTYFGIYLFFSSWVLIETKDLINNSKKNTLILINILCIIFLAKSATVVLFIIYVMILLFIVKIYYFSLNVPFSKKLFAKQIIFCFIIFVVIYLLKDQLNGSRIISIFSKINDGSMMSVLANDWSINSRVEAIYFSVVGAFKNYLIPGGLDTFREMRSELFESMNSNVFSNRYNSVVIMSWNGSLLYDLGIFGVAIIILFFKAIYRKFRGSLLYFLSLFIILFSAIPIGFTFVPMLISLMVYSKNYDLLENVKK